MKKLILLILSSQFAWSAWTMDSINGSKNHTRQSSRSSLHSNRSSKSTRSRKSFTFGRKSSDTSKSPRLLRKSSSSLKNGSSEPELYETYYKQYQNFRLTITVAIINPKKSIAAWKWYAQYLDEHPNESMKPYSKTVRNNLNLFKEMHTATQENPDELEYIAYCNAQYKKLWDLINCIEECNTLNKQIENKHRQIENLEIIDQKTASIPQLTKKRSSKNLFIKLFYPLSETLSAMLTDIRAGNKKPDGKTDKYTFEDLFNVYSIENQLHSSERKRNSLTRIHSELLSERKAAQDDPDCTQADITQKTQKIDLAHANIKKHAASHKALEKKLKSLKKLLGFLSKNGTANGTTSK